jgi:hypothetical protein
MMQNRSINSPRLYLVCPQAKANIDNHDHMFRERGIDKIKYGHEGIMIFIITTIYHHKTSHEKLTIHPQDKV